ncbi:MAG TPA: hypothetical protein PL085_11470 [Agriterribacter sp.]|uniref:hypothetical protein n=1 Tax=Agriterribacter sp. TaxID=2821509 RepID=UPI002B7B487C|nr:hypothetical protein [Agriterribacter sp.]HRQ17688.1 hypothetical protein [Agriterribacter sp.]
MIIYIQIIYLLICIAEAWLEQAVIYLKSPTSFRYETWNKKEHARSAVYAISVGLSLAAFPAIYGDIVQTVILIPLIFFIRRIGFDFVLKLFRGRRISDIEGNAFVDREIRNILGPKGGWYELLICIVIVSIVNYLAL